MDEALLESLCDWLRIPSISTGGGDPRALRDAAEFVAARVRDAGGEAELVTIGEGNPVAVGELRAADPHAPTVILYGHYDVQGIGDPQAWRSPPFEPEIRGGRIYARGASDDKGNVLPLLHAACSLAAAGELPVHVRVVVEGEEEAGGAVVERWLAQDERGADCAIVFDSAMEDPQTPAITLGLRGMVAAWLTVTTQPRDLHSGLYGGVALNAAHVLLPHRGRAAQEDGAGNAAGGRGGRAGGAAGGGRGTGGGRYLYGRRAGGRAGFSLAGHQLGQDGSVRAGPQRAGRPLWPGGAVPGGGRQRPLAFVGAGLAPAHCRGGFVNCPW